MKQIRVRKYLLFIITIFASFSANIIHSCAMEYVNYNGIHISNDEYKTLLNLGFTDDQIYHMTNETYLNNKDLDAKLVSQTQRYYKTVYPTYGNGYTVEISKDEYDSADTANKEIRGTVNTAYKTVVSSISQNGNKYRYNVSTAWKIMPSTRSFDIIGIGYSDPVSISGFVNFNYTYADPYGNYTTSTLYYNKKSTSTGGSAVYLLPSGQINALSSTLYYDVVKNTNSTITTLGICGDYSHAQSSVPQANVADYSIGISGINLQSSISGYYDAIPCAMEYASVNW